MEGERESGSSAEGVPPEMMRDVKVVVVRGAVSADKACGKSFYVRNVLAKQGDKKSERKEYMVIPVNEAFSVEAAADRMAGLKGKTLENGCVIHFKVTPYCDAALFNEFLSSLFVKQSCFIPRGVIIAFEIEEGEDLSLERFPLLSSIRDKYKDNKEVFEEVLITKTMEDVRKVVFSNLLLTKDGSSNEQLFLKPKLEFPDCAMEKPKAWIYQKQSLDKNECGKFGMEDPVYCTNHAVGERPMFDEKGVCPVCGKNRGDVSLDTCWRVVSDVFGIDPSMQLKVRRSLEDERRFVMDRRTVLRMNFLNECIMRNQPIVIKKENPGEVSEMVYIMALLRNSWLAFDYFSNRCKTFLGTFFRGSFVSARESLEQSFVKAKDFYENTKRDRAPGFCISVHHFLTGESENQPFYYFRTNATNSEEYANRFHTDGGIDFALDDLREYARTKMHFFQRIVMDESMTEARLSTIIEGLFYRVNEFKKLEVGSPYKCSFKFILLIDECASTNLMGLIKEILIDHSFKGVDLPPQVVVIGTYNKNDKPPKSFDPFEIIY